MSPTETAVRRLATGTGPTTRAALLLFSLALAALAGCGDDASSIGPVDAGGDSDRDAGADSSDGSGDGSGDYAHLDYTLSENATILDGALLEGLRSFDSAGTGDVVFEGETPGADAFAAGSVLVAGLSEQTPNGLLRVVTTVEDTGSELVLHTAPTSLVAAFRRLDLDMRGSFPAADLWPTAQPKGSAGSSFTHPFGGDVDWIVFDGDGDYSTDEDQVRVHGHLGAWATYSFVFSYDLGVLGDIDPFDIPPDLNPVDVDLRFDFSVDLGANVDITGEGAAALSYEKDVPLGTLPLPAFGVGPLVFTPLLKAVGHIQGGATGDFSIRSGFDTSFGGGLGFSVDDGFEPTLHSPTFEPTEPSADLEIGANGRVSVDIEVQLLMEGIIGPKAGLSVWAGVDADIHRDPCWRANIGADAIVGVVIALYSVELADWEDRWPIASTEIGHGDCPLGSTFDPPPAWSGSLGDSMAYTFSPDDASTFVDRGIDGNVLVAGQSSRGLYKFTPDGVPVWARAYRDVDSTLGGLFAVTAVAHRLDTGLIATTDADALLWLDAAGGLEAARRVEVGSHQRLAFYGAATGADGSVVVASRYNPDDGTARDVAVLRVAPDGTISGWRWGAADWNDQPYSVSRWGDGYAVAVSSQKFGESPDTVTWLLRLDANAALIGAWRLAPCSDPEELVLRAVAETEDGHVVLGGYQRFSAPRAAMVNVDVDGTVGWATLNRTSNLLGYDITGLAQLDSGAWLVTGTRMYAAPDDAFVARTDSAGRFIWVRSFGGDGAEEAPGVLAFGDGSAVVATSSDSFAEGSAGWWLSGLDVRDGALTLDPSLPVRAYADEFTPVDSCVASTAGSTATTPLTVTATDIACTEEPAPGTWAPLL
ncbi:MAG: hypothetical protein H6700_04140 [Myxococcales bacterium]|nr:hypothetical protein [Myxococcales bacterium]MCB9530934.1 hypothetical protein [Myxococcales bacterium]